MDKHVFFDLDETLFSTGRVVHADAEIFPHNPIIDKLGTDMFFVSYLRPGAKKLIDAVCAVVPKENIHVVTAASPDYAEYFINAHKLGFHPSRVYHDRHLKGKTKAEKLQFVADAVPRAYLLDNLPRHELGNKLSFLHRCLGFPIDQLYTYKIHDYYGPARDNAENGGISDAEIEDIVAFIKGMTPSEPRGIPYSPWG